MTYPLQVTTRTGISNTVLRGLRVGALALAIVASPAIASAELLWFGDAQSAEQARRAIALLKDAASHGLEPQDYDAERLDQAVQNALLDAGRLAEPARSQLDTALTRAMQRYLSDLQAGRVLPSQIHANFTPPRHGVSDIAASLRSAVAEQRLDQAVQQIATQLPMSAALRRELAYYRGLEGDNGWQTALPTPAGGKLIEGQAYAGLAELARRLRLLGDLTQGPLPTRFEGPLVTALEQFQQRHGLVRDGVLGRNTLAQLNLTPTQRARQIELTLERLRWTPYLQAPRMIVVNLPEFVLRAYEVDQGQISMRLTMKIIVGTALDNRTPLFDEDLRYIEFSPYWNVPRSIATRELVPQLRADPAYFANQGFEFVTDGRDVVETLTEEHLDAVVQGGWRIRQRPGPKNALGDIKFIFPNNANIYLHHTPSIRLFDRARRDLSHGCIRVENPVALARFVLQDDPAWTEERIRAAMSRGKSSTIRLQQPLPVLIAYRTVVVQGGLIHFFPDLYGHDALLDRLLRARSDALLRERRFASGGS